MPTQSPNLPITEEKIYIDYTLQHPKTKEIRVVTLPLKKIEEYFEEYELLECDCTSIGETNVIECNCGDYLQEFEIIGRSVVKEPLNLQQQEKAKKEAIEECVKVLEEMVNELKDCTGDVDEILREAITRINSN